MSTSKLQKAVGNLLDETFPEFDIKENHRPEWLLSSNLTRLELDYYIDELKLAFEIQGRQHYEYTPHFHKDYAEFEQRKQYDVEKKDLCYGRGITLIEVSTLLDAIISINDVREKLDSKKTRKLIGISLDEVRAEKRKIETLRHELDQEYTVLLTLEQLLLTGYDPDGHGLIANKKSKKTVLNKYREDLEYIKQNENPIATPDEIKLERDQFRRKFIKFYKNAKNYVRVPYFEFRYLGYNDRCSLFDEYDLLADIFPE